MSLVGVLALVGCTRENAAFGVAGGSSAGTEPTTGPGVTTPGTTDKPQQPGTTTPGGTGGTGPADTGGPGVDDGPPLDTGNEETGLQETGAGDGPTGCLEEIAEPCNAYDPEACGAGRKCSPHAALDDGAGARCIPLVGDGFPGDECSLVCDGFMDDCSPGTICVPEDDGPFGTCVQMCGPPESGDTCPDPGMACVDFEGFGMCLLACYPIGAADCPGPDGVCAAFPDWFACIGGTEPLLGPGQICTGQDECLSGLGCAPGGIGGCGAAGAAGEGCCLPYCELGSEFGCPLDQTCTRLGKWTWLPSNVPEIGVCVGA